MNLDKDSPTNPGNGYRPDVNKIIQRAKAILLTPKTEWPIIAAEPATVVDLYKNYFAILAAIPAVFGFIKGSLIGYSLFGGTVKVPLSMGITNMVLTYAITLGMIYILALIVDALAPSFAAERNPLQALKLVGYSYTASWIAGAAVILPFLGMLVVIAGAIYGIYLIFLGLPHTMKCPPERAGAYTAVIVVIAIVIGFIAAALIGSIAGTGALMSSMATSR